MADRMEKLRREHAESLHERISEATANPRRKTLHALRLKIKPIRYQEDWALDQAYARPEIVSRLKRAQSVLGDYEERAQFRKLARTLHLKSYARILKDWRRAKTRARTLPAQAYTSEEFFEWETTHLLRAGWQCVAHISQIPQPGDFHRKRQGEWPALLSRGETGAESRPGLRENGHAVRRNPQPLI